MFFTFTLKEIKGQIDKNIQTIYSLLRWIYDAIICIHFIKLVGTTFID
jgi:hypothetical protein